MRNIIKIARAELRTLFYSPIAWVVLVVFFAIAGALFVGPLQDIARVQELSLNNSPFYKGAAISYSEALFESPYSAILFYMYLFIPLITMGVFSRELNSGSIKFLYSSPVRIRELVLGKYLGLILFNMTMLLSVVVLLATGAFSILHAEYKVFLSAFLGFFLLSSTYAAIGLFISALTSYQLLAGLATIIVFILLGVVELFGQQYDFIRDLTYFLALPNRVDRMLKGLITSRDVLYFLLIIAMFIGFTLVKLKSTQEFTRKSTKYGRYLLIFVAVLLLGYFSSRPGKVLYLDVTSNQVHTIDTAVQNVLKELDGSPLTITWYGNLMSDNFSLGSPAARNNYIWNIWDKYRRFYPNMIMKYEYYYKIDQYNQNVLLSYPDKDIHEIAAMMARSVDVNISRFRKPQEIDSIFNFGDEPARQFMILEYKGKKAILRMLTESPYWPEQPMVAGSLKRVASERPPEIIFTTGHYERSPYKHGEREYSAHTNDIISKMALTNLGVNVDTLSLLRDELPVATDVLVVADPKTMLEDTVQAKIRHYIDKGGNALIYGEAGKENVLNPLLKNIGIQLIPGTMFDLANEFSKLSIGAGFTTAAWKLSGEFVFQDQGADKKDKHQEGKEFFDIYYPQPTRITYENVNGFTVNPLFVRKGSDNIWIEGGRYVPDSALATFSEKEGDYREDEYVLAVQLTRMVNGKEQRIIVAGDADHMSKFHGNGYPINNSYYSWLLYNKYPVYVTHKFPKDTLLTIGRTTGNLLYTLFVYIIPALVLVTGMIILIRRKRK